MTFKTTPNDIFLQENYCFKADFGNVLYNHPLNMRKNHIICLNTQFTRKVQNFLFESDKYVEGVQKV